MKNKNFCPIPTSTRYQFKNLKPGQCMKRRQNTDCSKDAEHNKLQRRAQLP